MLVFDDGYRTMTARHLKLNRIGIYQFHRRIPEDLQHHYDGRSHIQQSLKTRDPVVAAKAAGALARSQDALWKTLRSPQGRELNLVPAETRAAAMSLLEHLGYVPGERLGDVKSNSDRAHGSLDHDPFRGSLGLPGFRITE